MLECSACDVVALAASLCGASIHGNGCYSVHSLHKEQDSEDVVIVASQSAAITFQLVGQELDWSASEYGR